MENKPVVLVGIGCVTGCLIGFILFTMLGAGAVAWLVNAAPEDVDTNLEHPIQVDAGDELTIEYRITNEGPELYTLYSIEFSEDFLEGVRITDAEPAYNEMQQFEAFGSSDGSSVYYFDQPILPGQTLTVTFTGTAGDEGDFSGESSVCLNSGFECLYESARTVIGGQPGE